jgi:hypothetical protein
VSDNRGRRHSIRTITQARRLAKAGWNPTEIRKLLIRDRYVDAVTLGTVTRWVDPEAQAAWEAGIVERNTRRARIRGTLPMGVRNATGEYKLSRARTLRELGMSESSIAKVMSFDFCETIEPHQVRYALRAGGTWPKAHCPICRSVDCQTQHKECPVCFRADCARRHRECSPRTGSAAA